MVVERLHQDGQIQYMDGGLSPTVSLSKLITNIRFYMNYDIIQ